ncbi:MAG: hypothetical protein INR64_05155 [Caulobacteraceae bacterium]|nr:hypothetical protein [Caulobacter sp.]
MAEADTDVDAQDTAEAFDEEINDGERADSDAFDLRPKTSDVTSALGDADLEGVDDAMDADEETDEDLDAIDVEGRAADTPDEDGDDLVDSRDLQPEPLDDDNVAMSTKTADVNDEDDEDGVSRLSASEPEEIAMDELELEQLDNTEHLRVSDLESDNLSDSDLKELGYE